MFMIYQTRKPESKSDESSRIIYWMATPAGPLQKTLIVVEECNNGGRLTCDPSCIRIHGMEHTLDLIIRGWNCESKVLYGNSLIILYIIAYMLHVTWRDLHPRGFVCIHGVILSYNT